MSTSAVTLPRSGPAVRDWLQANAPDEAAQFDREFAQALHEAGDTFDLAAAEGVVTRWWGLAWARTQELTTEEQNMLERFHHGQVAGLLTQDTDGTFHRL